VASARVRRQPSRNRTAAFLPFILHHVQERCWNGQAHELTRIGDNIDDSPVDRRANRTLIQLGACFLELRGGGVASRLGLSNIFLARSRPQQGQPGSRLRELRGKNPRVSLRLQHARRGNANSLTQRLRPFVGFLRLLRACRCVADGCSETWPTPCWLAHHALLAVRAKIRSVPKSHVVHAAPAGPVCGAHSTAGVPHRRKKRNPGVGPRAYLQRGARPPSANCVSISARV